MTLDIQLLRPLWLLALLPLALLVLALWRHPQRDANRWRSLIAPHLLPHLLTSASTPSQRLPLILLSIGWTLLVLALAGPVSQRLPQPVFTTGGQRVLLLDLSPSMNAADIAPSRLARARFEMLDLLRGATEGQIALIAFGAEPFVVAPLTGDAQTIAAQVPLLTDALLPAPGERRLDLALQLAGELLTQARARHGEVIVVTDGVGDLARAQTAAQQLVAAGHRLSVLAVGTAKGAPIPTGSGSFRHNAAGEIEMARVDAAGLQQLAAAGDGRYVAAVVGDADTRMLLALGAPQLTAAATATAFTSDQWREDGVWLLLPLLPLAAVAFRRGWLLPVLALAFIMPLPTEAASWADLWQRPAQQAAAQLATGATAAASQFDDPAWQAAAHYRAGAFQEALTALDGMTGAEAAYNRGNALARLGRLEEAAAAYRRALQQVPDHADAQHNLAQVEQLLKQQPPSSSAQNQQNQSQNKDQNHDKNQQSDPQSAPAAGAQKQPPDAATDAANSADQQDAGAQSDAASAANNSPAAEDLQPAAASQPAPASKTSEPSAPPPPSNGEQKSPVEKGEFAELNPEQQEQQQALDAQLRRVPDDPAGLLRQRFLLQHLRREGRLP